MEVSRTTCGERECNRQALSPSAPLPDSHLNGSVQAEQMFLVRVSMRKLRQPYCGEVVLGLRKRRLASWKTEALLHASAIADSIRQLVNLVRYLV